MALKQTVYLHDGSFEGFLNAVAVAVKSAARVKGVYAETVYKPFLFETPITLHRDRKQALRFLKYLQGLGRVDTRLAINGFLSEDPEAATHLYRMIQACLVSGCSVSRCYANDSVAYLQNLSKKVTREAHRFKGFIRFRVLEEGVQYGPFEPEFNVIGYCATHFRTRLKTRRWILHDLSRNLAMYWDGSALQYIKLDKDFSDHVLVKGEVPESMLDDAEKYYQQLWQKFHCAIANEDRENRGLQRQHIPQRYWKYLIELP